MKKHLEEEEAVLSHKSMRSLKQAGITAVFTGQTINVCASLNIEKVNMKSQFTLCTFLSFRSYCPHIISAYYSKESKFLRNLSSKCNDLLCL